MKKISKNIIGNDKLIDKLTSNFLNQNLSHSIIFSGQKGIGKASSALFLINQIYKKIDTNNVQNTNLIYNNSHPNIKYISKLKDEKTNKIKKNISIDQIRLLENFLNQSTFNNLPKFVVIDSSDDLNISSSNSLLKSLEEPKKNTFFILICHHISSLLPTIRSRCINQIFAIPNYHEFSNIFQNNNGAINISELNFLYYASSGSPGLAIKIYNENIIDIFNNIIQIFVNNEPLSKEVINLSNEISNYSNQELKNFIIFLRFIIISFVKINLGYTFDNHKPSELLDYLTKTAKLVPNTITIKILEFLDENEKDMFIYNLDKKYFCLNIFSPLKKI